MNNRLMRILVFFDLTVKTKAERGAAAKFRNFLLMDGYHTIQLSVYARICNGTDSVAAHKLRLAAAVPAKGSVRMLVITERQYSNIQILLEKSMVYDEPQQMEQLMLFRKLKQYLEKGQKTAEKNMRFIFENVCFFCLFLRNLLKIYAICE